MLFPNAENIKIGDNPPYTVADFLSFYPGFEIVPEPVLQTFIHLAHASVKQIRYGDAWQLCMGYFVAHFATLHMEGMADAGSPAGQVLEAGRARGLRVSESAGDVSAGYDYNAVAQDLEGWAAWKLTVYGQQLASLAKVVGKGGMLVW